MSTWILALQIDNALRSETTPDDSILGEFFQVGAQHAVTGKVVSEHKPWVIPARGTAQHANATHIHQILKQNPDIEATARALVALRAENVQATKLLAG